MDRSELRDQRTDKKIGIHGPIKILESMDRVTAREFFGHNFRELAGNRLIFCMLRKMLIAHSILHGRVLGNF